MAESLKSVLKAFTKITSTDQLPYWQQEARRLLNEMPKTCHFSDGCSDQHYGGKFCNCKRLKLADFS